MSETAKAAVAKTLTIMVGLPDILAVRLLGIAEGMAAANAVRDALEAVTAERVS